MRRVELSENQKEIKRALQSYQEWSKVSESYYTCNPGVLWQGCTRDCYHTPFNVDVFDHWVSPYSPFKSAYGYTVVDLVLPVTEDTRGLLQRYGGKLDEHWYTEKGFGLPFFKTKDSCRSAWVFLYFEKEKLVNHK